MLQHACFLLSMHDSIIWLKVGVKESRIRVDASSFKLEDLWIDDGVSSFKLAVSLDLLTSRLVYFPLFK